MTVTYRAVFISDVHLGTSACRASDLLEFLNTVQTERLYLVGDIIDIERMKGRASFTPEHHKVLLRIVQLASAGTEVIYIPGNHDREVRALTGSNVRGVKVQMEAVYTTAAGKRFLVTHGDVLDRHVRKHSRLELVGAAAYNLLLSVDARLHRVSARFGRDHVPISSRLKQSVASASRYIAKFESFAAHYAQRRGFDGIICGHIHKPALRDIGGVCYANDGDWVEHRTALMEDETGVLELKCWRPRAGGNVAASQAEGALAA